MNLNEIIANIVIPAAIAGILTPIIMKGILKTSWGQKIFKHKDNASEPKNKKTAQTFNYLPNKARYLYSKSLYCDICLMGNSDPGE